MEIVVELLASSVPFWLGSIPDWRTEHPASGKPYGYHTDDAPLEQRGMAFRALVGKIPPRIYSWLHAPLSLARRSCW